jgi:hypothetical protein
MPVDAVEASSFAHIKAVRARAGVDLTAVAHS